MDTYILTLGALLPHPSQKQKDTLTATYHATMADLLSRRDKGPSLPFPSKGEKEGGLWDHFLYGSL